MAQQNTRLIQQGLYQHNADNEALRSAARNQALILLQQNEMPLALKRFLLKHLLGFITTLNKNSEKFRCRYRSLAVRDDVQLAQTVEHEHVYPISQMIDHLLVADDLRRACILNSAVGCVVTSQEHEPERLRNEIPVTPENLWDRYREAVPPVVVIDTVTNQLVF